MSNLTVLEVLEGMDKVLSSPDKWVQGHYAEDADGNSVWANDENAVRFCLLGAARKAAGRESEPYEVKRYLEGALPQYIEQERYVASFNDDRRTTFRKVKALIRRAIKLAHAESVANGEEEIYP